MLASSVADRKVVGSNPTRSGKIWRREGGSFEAGVGVGVGVVVGVGVSHGVFGVGNERIWW